MKLVEEAILKLEKELLTSETRKSSKKINEILDCNFMEFCSSGTIYNYKNGDVFQDNEDDFSSGNFMYKQ